MKTEIKKIIKLMAPLAPQNAKFGVQGVKPMSYKAW